MSLARIVLAHPSSFLVGGAVLAASAWGCALVAGVDFDAARLGDAEDAASGAEGLRDGGSAMDSGGRVSCASGAPCPAGELCAPTGCVKSCPSPLVPCAGACVDTTTSAAHCGGCSQRCDAGPNAEPVCTGGTCLLACRPGFGDCTAASPKTCTELPRWFLDADGDGFGSAVFVQACSPPAGHVAVSGDCLDTNANVHPDAGARGAPFAGDAGPSFDYDCSGTEEEVPPFVHFGGACFNCSETGYVPTGRIGPGVNEYCGSGTVHQCSFDRDFFCLDLGESPGFVPVACR